MSTKRSLARLPEKITLCAQLTLATSCFLGQLISLPEIAVQVERWKFIIVKFQSLDGEVKFLENLSPENSELLQHEIDHLNGILMTHRMTDANQIISREFKIN